MVTPETCKSVRQYRQVEVGQYYRASAKDVPQVNIEGLVRVADIRIWSDGMKDVMLEHQDHSGWTHCVTIDKLAGTNPFTGKPMFNREILQ